MQIVEYFQTKNDCYKKGGKHKVKGVMWHSTGANNPRLSRYVGPDDGRLGKNKYNNHWNQSGISKMPHAFIGQLENGDVAVYQTLPWDMPGWHSGTGSLGQAKNANNSGIVGFEICEDNLQDKAYFEKVYAKGIELTAYILKLFNLPVNKDTVFSHAEGHKKGVASNHGDPDHWLKKFGKSMDTVRKDVQKKLDEWNISKEEPKEEGNTYTLVTSVKGYLTADNAEKRKDHVVIYAKGTYHIYKTAKNGMINITKSVGSPGAWINPLDNIDNENVDYSVGQRVRVKTSAKKYATGQTIPEWVKGRTYIIDQIKGDRVLLDRTGICSWFFKKDVE